MKHYFVSFTRIIRGVAVEERRERGSILLAEHPLDWLARQEDEQRRAHESVTTHIDFYEQVHSSLYLRHRERFDG